MVVVARRAPLSSQKLDAKKPVIICGDMNVAHNEIDLKNPKTNKKNAGSTETEYKESSESNSDQEGEIYYNFLGKILEIYKKLLRFSPIIFVF